MFAFIIGKCVWLPPSAKAAILFPMLFYGYNAQGTPLALDPQSYIHGMQEIQQQYTAAGLTTNQAKKKIIWLNDCITSWGEK